VLQVQYSLVSRGPQQQVIKSVCDDLGVKLISYSPLGLGLLTGKYDTNANVLPSGPRSLLFRQILPGLQPLVEEMCRIANARKKTVPQVCCVAKTRCPSDYIQNELETHNLLLVLYRYQPS
jgi:pyridoxine 4-dehydrogenase